MAKLSEKECLAPGCPFKRRGNPGFLCEGHFYQLPPSVTWRLQSLIWSGKRKEAERLVTQLADRRLTNDELAAELLYHRNTGDDE